MCVRGIFGTLEYCIPYQTNIRLTKVSKFQLGVENFVRRKILFDEILSGTVYCPTNSPLICIGLQYYSTIIYLTFCKCWLKKSHIIANLIGFKHFSVTCHALLLSSRIFSLINIKVVVTLCVGWKMIQIWKSLFLLK